VRLSPSAFQFEWLCAVSCESEFEVTFTNDLLVNYLNIGCPEYRIGVVDAARMEGV